MGYVPLFDHLTTGTLYGKWPDIGLWPVLLSMADRHGKIDVTPQFIAGVTGLEVEEVVACIGRFCAPDPFSRTRADEGRRLEPIDPDRSWGWRVVNHAAYREKARLMAKDAARTSSGVDAERKRAERARPPLSPEFPLSDSDTNTNKDKKVPTEPVPQKRDCDAIQAVFNHWKSVHGHPRAQLDDKRRRIIRAALANYTADQLCEAISGYQNSPHHMGVNDRGTRYDDICLFLRDASHIDAGIAFATNPPMNVSSLTRRNIAAVEDWVPPEMRNATN